MKITIHGAGGGEVTGSAYLVQSDKANVLVDCGMFQGAKKLENYNRQPSPIAVKNIDSVVLTHAHLDHTGRLPILTKLGYTGPIYATPATIDIADLILRDSAYLQLADVERENRKRARRGEEPLECLYTNDDVFKLRPLFQALPYEKHVPVAEGVSIRAVEAGHMLGSASLEMVVQEGDKKRTIVFSGDLGPRGAPLHRDPTPFKQADVVFMESTYGDRDHKSLHDSAIQARELIKQAVEERAKILVPAFAVGRTQLLLYLLAGAFHRGTLPAFPVYIDSPMAIEATKIYGKHVELFDEEALAMQSSGELRANLETAKFCPTPNDSRALNDTPGPCMILAGAGMCTGGRILHHFRHNLPIPSTRVFIVGFQSHGSLGRMLVDGKKAVRIFGEEIPVRASVHTIGGMSGHAGQTDLMHWFGSLAPSRPRVVLTHGEAKARQCLARLIRERHKVQVEQPNLGEVIDIA